MSLSDWHLAVKLADQPLAPKSILQLPETELGECSLGGYSISFLKQLIAGKLQESVPDPELIDLIYCGRKLKDDQTLDFYGIQPGSTVHVLRKSWPEPDQKPEPVDKVAAQREFRVLHTALHSSSSYREAVFKMLSNKESLDQIIAATPGLSSDPIALGVLQDKDLFSVFADPSMLDTLVPAHPALVNAIILVLHSVAGSTPMPGADASSRSMPSSSYRDMPGGFLFEGLSDDEEDFHPSTRSTPSSSTPSSRPASLGYSGAAGPRPITQSELATALALASTPESSSHTPTPGTQGHSSGTSPMSSGVQSGTPITNDLFSQALQHALQASGQPSLQSQWQPQLQQLRDMGIQDDELSLRALQATGGDIQAALELIFAGGHTGQDRLDFGQAEPHTVLFHEPGSPSVWVGGRGKVYRFDFPEGKNASVHMVNISSTKGTCVDKQQDCENYITLLERRSEGLLACGTNARRPSCWNLVNDTVVPLGEMRGYAPFSPDENSLVLFEGDEVYSTIRKQEYNGKIPRFRRIQGESELYTSDTVMQNPQFIKATIVHQDQAYDDKIYYFFREDNPDKNPESPLNVSRVAQLCRGDQGGESSLSVSKWNTFLKAMLVCSDATTNKNFNRLQDVFLLPDPSGNWKDTKVYGVFSNPWNYSAVCVYSLGDIDRVFRTSSLKGYHMGLPNPRPGKCLPNQKPIPTQTFQVADSHPEVAQRVEPMGPLKMPLFHSKYHYQKVVVHRMQARNEGTFHVLYLTTDRGTIHKVVESGEREHSVAFNIMEIQPFHRMAAIQGISLDAERRKLYVTSQWEVSQVPLDLCDVYGGGCHGCLMSRDPYCGWDQDRCVSIYSCQRPLLQSINPAEPHKECPNPKPDEAPLQKVSLARNSRYYLSCPMESRHATYSWRHEENVEQSCEPGHQSPNCILFIENLTARQYGHYRCEAREGSYLREAQHWELLPEDRALAEHLLGHACVLATSLWLGVLPTLALGLLVH